MRLEAERHILAARDLDCGLAPVHGPMDALQILSSVAVTQTAVAMETLTRSGVHVLPLIKRKFSILDIPLSQFMEEQEEEPRDVCEGYNAPTRRANTSILTSEGQTLNSPAAKSERLMSDESSVFRSDDGLDNMDPTEIDMRMKLAALQAKYKENQRELARLQRRNTSNNDVSRSVQNSPARRQRSRRSGACSSRRSTASSRTAASSVNSDSEGLGDMLSDSEPPLRMKVIGSPRSVGGGKSKTFESGARTRSSENSTHKSGDTLKDSERIGRQYSENGLKDSEDMMLDLENTTKDSENAVSGLESRSRNSEIRATHSEIEVGSVLDFGLRPKSKRSSSEGIPSKAAEFCLTELKTKGDMGSNPDKQVKSSPGQEKTAAKSLLSSEETSERSSVTVNKRKKEVNVEKRRSSSLMTSEERKMNKEQLMNSNS